MTVERTMRIGEVTERTELSNRTLHHYEEIGLLVPSARTEGGFRLYTESDVSRILLIRRMKPLGYSLEEMRELLDVVEHLADEPDDPEFQLRLRRIREGAADRREKLGKQLEMADEFIEQLARV